MPFGIPALVAEGVRGYFRVKRRQEINRITQELLSEPPVDLQSTTVPARAVLLHGIREALAAACPPGWSLDDGDVLAVRSPDGPQLLVELEPAGCSSRSGRSADHVGTGARTYWLVDPVGPSLTVLALDGGRFVERERHRGETWSTTDPFPVTLSLQAPHL